MFPMPQSDGRWPSKRKEVARLVSVLGYGGVGLER